MTLFAFTIWDMPRSRLGAVEDLTESSMSSVVLDFLLFQQRSTHTAMTMAITSSKVTIPSEEPKTMASVSVVALGAGIDATGPTIGCNSLEASGGKNGSLGSSGVDGSMADSTLSNPPLYSCR